MKMGLVDMVGDMMEREEKARSQRQRKAAGRLKEVDAAVGGSVAGVLTAIDNEAVDEAVLEKIRARAGQASHVPVVGLTGTGGAGKSSVTDELLNRFLQFFPAMRIAVLAVDPTRRRPGGALLGGRIRTHTPRSAPLVMRCSATRR